MDSLVLTAFTMGLLGGAHCFGMCGGIVGAVSASGAQPRFRTQVYYNTGRILSYGVAGSFAGAFGAIGTLANGVLPAQMALFIVANAMVVLLGLYIAGWGRLILHLELAGAAVWRRVSPFGKRFLPADTLGNATALGLVWGWLPCGLVYSALALALVSGDPLRGALVLIAFGLGTLPNLLAAGLAARRMRAALRQGRLRMLAGCLIVALGVVGFARIPGLGDAVRGGMLCLAQA